MQDRKRLQRGQMERRRNPASLYHAVLSLHGCYRKTGVVYRGSDSRQGIYIPQAGMGRRSDFTDDRGRAVLLEKPCGKGHHARSRRFESL